MPWWGWVIIGCVISPLVIKILAAALGAAVPRQVSGMALLRKELEDRGLDPSLIPQAELDSAVSVAKFMSELNDGTKEWTVTKFAQAIGWQAEDLARRFYLGEIERP